MSDRLKLVALELPSCVWLTEEQKRLFLERLGKANLPLQKFLENCINIHASLGSMSYTELAKLLYEPDLFDEPGIGAPLEPKGELGTWTPMRYEEGDK